MKLRMKWATCLENDKPAFAAEWRGRLYVVEKDTRPELQGFYTLTIYGQHLFSRSFIHKVAYDVSGNALHREKFEFSEDWPEHYKFGNRFTPTDKLLRQVEYYIFKHRRWRSTWHTDRIEAMTANGSAGYHYSVKLMRVLDKRQEAPVSVHVWCGWHTGWGIGDTITLLTRAGNVIARGSVTENSLTWPAWYTEPGTIWFTDLDGTKINDGNSESFDECSWAQYHIAKNWFATH